MVHSDRLLITLIRSYAAARGISVSYASRLLTGSGDTVDRVTAGASITARRAETILRRASQRWPDGRAWPTDIPRPAPEGSEEATRERLDTVTFRKNTHLTPALLLGRGTRGRTRHEGDRERWGT